MLEKHGGGKRRFLTAGVALLLLLSGGLMAASDAVPLDKLADPGAPASGPKDAKVVIVEFSDFQCPYCASMGEVVEALRAASPEQIRVIWMDRPLVAKVSDGYPFHPYAMIAHEAGVEAQKEGKFTEFQLWVERHRGSVFPAARPQNDADYLIQQDKVTQRLLDACGELGLDRKKMELALSTHIHLAEVEKRLEMGRALNINSTPTIYVNGIEIGSDVQKAIAAVQKALAAGPAESE